MSSHVEFAFHYRITEFMRLIVDDVDFMETDGLMEVAEWMMKKIRGRVCPFAARFSIDEEDEVEVDNITVAFLFDLLLTCQKRQVERVDFEVESEPRTVCWKCHTFAAEKIAKDPSKDIPLFEPTDVEFDAGFIDFLKKLEERQEMIKESALRLLSPPRPSVLPEQNRLEKSVQTTGSCTALPADAFVPELPSPDLAEFHDAQVDIGSSVDNFVDALFDFEPKSKNNSAVFKRYPASRFFPSRNINWGNQAELVGCWGNSSRKIALPWSCRSLQQFGSVREMNSPSTVEDLIALHDSAAICHRVQKKWDRLQSEAGLSMTAALSTGIGGVEECSQEQPQPEKKSKRRENEEWVAALLKMLEQKPTKSRKLLRGLINYSKEHKSSKSSKSRSAAMHPVLPSKHSDSETKESSSENGPAPSADNANPAVDVYEYMRMKLKEHEKSKKDSGKEAKVESKPKKVKKEKNQNDIRVYLVGRKVSEPSCKTCGAQTDIRDYLVGKKVKVSQEVEIEPSTVTATPQKEQSKATKIKSLSKNRIAGKYVKLNKTPTVAVVGESNTRFVGRLSYTAVVYGKSFKLTNLSRKELHLSVAPIDWPEHIQLLHPISATILAPGQTKDMAVTVTRSDGTVASECHLLSIVHRKTTVSHVLTFRIDAMAVHHEGPLLSELYTPEEVKMITTFRPVLNLPRPLDEGQQQSSDEAEATETVHTVINMLKDEVDSMCTGVIPQTKVEANSVHTLTGTGVIECNQMTDSVHTAIGDTEEECIAALEKVTVTEAAEETASDSSGSDFELIDVDEGGSISSSEAEESDFVTA
uniref:Retrovirus-related Pol polyprotein from transposon TNT 1-94 n=1 Tax=Haemonchus contortus TaxID=6289 RepID=A0A7I4Y747_HAECO